MADRLVDAWNESHASEASEALMICFDNASPEMSCFVIDLVCICFVLPISCFVSEYHRKELESSTAERVLFFFVSEVASQGKLTKESSS